MVSKKTAVVALGGNALVKEGQKGDIHEQFANTREVSTHIVSMIKKDWKVILTHGNGPQVGAILLQNNLSRDVLPPMPLGVCVAESQGLIGYMIQQCLTNALKKEDIDIPVASVITQVLVDKKDPSFKNPTKPIGPYYEQKDIKQLEKDGYTLKEFSKGWRIVVPSPDPISIVEKKAIKQLIDDEILVVAAGGGGMPVVEKKDWVLDGVEAVVDKDLASERLAEDVQADVLLILTNVERVFLNYNTDKQEALETVSLSEVKKYYEDGHFPPGNMGPKILAAIRFLESGGKKVIISHVECGWQAFKGETGTHITQ
jgi:carbamate kinase